MSGGCALHGSMGRHALLHLRRLQGRRRLQRRHQYTFTDDQLGWRRLAIHALERGTRRTHRNGAGRTQRCRIPKGPHVTHGVADRLYNRLSRRCAQRRTFAPDIKGLGQPVARKRTPRHHKQIRKMGGESTLGPQLFGNPNARSAVGHLRDALTSEFPRHGDGTRPEFQIHAGTQHL